MLLSTSRVGALIGYQPVTVARKLRTGEIPGGVKCGSQWRLPDEALEAFLAQIVESGVGADAGVRVASAAGAR
jgi:hypothetical protein